MMSSARSMVYEVRQPNCGAASCNQSFLFFCAEYCIIYAHLYSANASPARCVFLATPGAKALLKPVLAPGNVDKSMAAPVTVIIAWDTEFHEHLPRLFPHADIRSYFVGNKPLIEENAFRNSSLQAGYFILAARAPGFDCGPMSGFDRDKLNAEFFPDGKWKVNLLCNLGYGDTSKLHPRNPRLNCEEASVIL